MSNIRDDGAQKGQVEASTGDSESQVDKPGTGAQVKVILLHVSIITLSKFFFEQI